MGEFNENHKEQRSPSEWAEALISEWTGSQSSIDRLVKTPSGESQDAKDAADEYVRSQMIDAEQDFTFMWADVPADQKEATVEELLKNNDAGAIGALALRDLSGISETLRGRLQQAAEGFKTERKE